jgi:putative membrane protein
VLFGALVSLVLSALSRGVLGLLSFPLAFLVFALSAAAISSALQMVDKGTMATFRRILALLLAGEILWLFLAAIGAVYSLIVGSANALTNALLYGAVVCSGLEFLIINGAFVRNAGVSLALAVIHPMSTLTIIRFYELRNHLDLFAAAAGAIALAVIMAFPLLLKGKKTSLGHDALDLFQAFMKAWTAGRSDRLEEIIADHSEEVEVTTKVLRFGSKSGDFFLVFPGVHPGPFHPVGSYDLPGVVSREFEQLGPVLTLHRPGGHERNLATRADTQKYAAEVRELARSIKLDDGQAVLRGPTHAQVGKATVSSSIFSRDMVITVSFAPLGSEDLDTRVEAEFSESASGLGLDLSVVDAHNSIDHNLESPVIDEPAWRGLFETTSKSKPERFKAAYAHSSEAGFKGGGDLTENGIGLFMVQSGNSNSVLVLADANNSIPTLREEVAKALDSAGYGLIEFCTSDSHNLAARGLTVERGYEALGESTPPASIAALVVKLANLAETRLAPAGYGSGKMTSRVRVFGSKALEEFATITQASSRFSRGYFRFAAAVVGGLLAAAIVL